jgi:hypothetical protein
MVMWAYVPTQAIYFCPHGHKPKSILIQWNLGSRIQFVPGGRTSPEIFVNRNYFILFNNILKKPQSTMKLKRRHGEFEQGCVLSECYTATDALPPILPACRQPLLSASCLLLETPFVTQDVFCSGNLFVMRGVRELRFHCIIFLAVVAVHC